MRTSTILTALVGLFPGAQVHAQQWASNRPTTTHEARPAAAAEAPTIDGRLDEAVWAEATPLTGFVQREPVEGRPVSERTEVRLVFDGSAIYVGAWMYDRDPDGVVFGETRRDASLGTTTRSRSSSTPTSIDRTASSSGRRRPGSSTTGRSSTKARAVVRGAAGSSGAPAAASI